MRLGVRPRRRAGVSGWSEKATSPRRTWPVLRLQGSSRLSRAPKTSAHFSRFRKKTFIFRSQKCCGDPRRAHKQCETTCIEIRSNVIDFNKQKISRKRPSDDRSRRLVRALDPFVDVAHEPDAKHLDEKSFASSTVPPGFGWSHRYFRRDSHLRLSDGPLARRGEAGKRNRRRCRQNQVFHRLLRLCPNRTPVLPARHRLWIQ